MLDSDLATLYQVETKVFNQAVRRNIKRFPDRFRFQLTQEEAESLRSQIVTSKKGERGGRRYLPYVFTEQGVAMISAVLRSETAICVSIQIMDAFVEMRHFIASNATMFEQIRAVELRQLEYQKTTDERFERVFDYMGMQGYFIGASLKDAGKKSFAISRIEDDESVRAILARLER